MGQAGCHIYNSGRAMVAVLMMIVWHIPLAVIVLALYYGAHGIAWVSKRITAYRRRHEPKG